MTTKMDLAVMLILSGIVLTVLLASDVRHARHVRDHAFGHEHTHANGVTHAH